MDQRIVEVVKVFIDDPSTDLEKIPSDKSLIELGIIDSLALSQILAQVEKVKGSPIDYSKLDYDSFSMIGLEKLLN